MESHIVLCWFSQSSWENSPSMHCYVQCNNCATFDFKEKKKMTRKKKKIYSLEACRKHAFGPTAKLQGKPAPQCSRPYPSHKSDIMPSTSELDCQWCTSPTQGLLFCASYLMSWIIKRLIFISLFDSETGLYAFLSHTSSREAVRMKWNIRPINYSTPPSCWEAVLRQFLVSDKVHLCLTPLL